MLLGGAMPISREQLTEALTALYDAPALASVSLIASLEDIALVDDPIARAQRLRGMLLDAIEEMQPPRPEGYRTPATRGYRVLTMHFVEGQTIAAIAEGLSISERQAYRDLARAEDQLCRVLEAYGGGASPQQILKPIKEVRRELEQMEADASLVDVVPLVRAAVDLVRPLAKVEGVKLQEAYPDGKEFAVVNPGMLRQICVQLLSAAVRGQAEGPVRLELNCEGEEADLTVTWVTSRREALASDLETLRDLARSQGMLWQVSWGRHGQVAVSLGLSRVRRLALIIEDNESALALYQRYLSGREDWTMLSSQSAQGGIDLALKHRPTVIVLDIMMPDCDGWSLLQMLKTQPELSQTPILVCTVFDEQKLAMALGASGYVKKPLTRQSFLQALDRCAAEAFVPARRPSGPTLAPGSAALR